MDLLKRTDLTRFPQATAAQLADWNRELERCKRNVEARAVDLALTLYRRAMDDARADREREREEVTI